MVHLVVLVVLACVSMATPKKGLQLFVRKKCTPEKIPATPMNLPTPGKNPEGAHDYLSVSLTSFYH